MRNWKLHCVAQEHEDSPHFNLIRAGCSIMGVYRSMLYPVFRQLDRSLTKWACRKYRKLTRHRRRAAHWITRISRREPSLFAHWLIGMRRVASTAGAG